MSHGVLLLLLLSSLVGGTFSEKCFTDLMVIIDNSGSVGDVFEQEKQLAAQLVSGVDVGQDALRVAYVEFNKAAETVFSFNQFNDRAAVAAQIKNLTQVGGSTNTADGLRLALTDFTTYGRPTAHKLILLITDGNSQNSVQELTSVVDQLNATGAKIYVATASDTPGLYEFNLFTGGHTDRVFVASNVTLLVPVVIRESACLPPVVYITTPKPTTPPPTTTTPATTSTTTTYPLTPQACALDVMFILDSSGSVREGFQNELNLMESIVNTLTVSPSAHNVAVVEYSGPRRQILEIGYDEHTDKESLLRAVRELPFYSGTTATGRALEFATSKLNTRRPTVKPIVIVITDGYSQDPVVGPAAQLRAIVPDTYVVSSYTLTNREELVNIAGDEHNVFTGTEADNVKRVFQSYLTCHS